MRSTIYTRWLLYGRESEVFDNNEHTTRNDYQNTYTWGDDGALKVYCPLAHQRVSEWNVLVAKVFMYGANSIALIRHRDDTTVVGSVKHRIEWTVREGVNIG